MRAGSRDERFELRIRLPCFTAGCAGPAGYVLDEVGSRLLGPGTATLQNMTSDYAFGTCVRGSSSATVGGSFSLPANTTTALVLRYRPLRPWDVTSYRIRFTVGGGNQARRRSILSGEPQRAKRRRGVRFALSGTRPGSGLLPRRSPVRVVGTTERSLAGRKVRLRFRHTRAQFATSWPRATRWPRSALIAGARFPLLLATRRFPAPTRCSRPYAGDRTRVRDSSCPIEFRIAR